MNSGIATMSRELVLGTLDKYHWVQIGGAIKNPNTGQVMDLTQATKELIKKGQVKCKDDDVYVKIYPVDGYGSEDILYSVINIERPDAIMHFTDPRFWGWLYQLEHTLRKKMPLVYLSIWDDIPYPMYNRPFYESCDALFAISKQTHNIHRMVRGPETCFTLDGWYDEKSNLHPHEKPLTVDYIIKNIAEVSEEILSTLDTVRPVTSISDPRIQAIHELFAERLSKRFDGVITNNGVMTYQKSKSILEKTWKEDTYPYIKRILEEKSTTPTQSIFSADSLWNHAAAATSTKIAHSIINWKE